MTSGRKMNLRQRPWLCLLTATLLPALVVQAASTSTSKRAIKGKNQTQRRRLQPPLPDNVPSNIFADGGKAGKAGKADSYKSCKERPTPTISPAPTKSPKTKYPTISPAPSITYSPTKSPKKTKAPTVPTVSPAPTVTFSPTKYPKYCSEAPTTDAPSHSAAPSITPRPTTQSPSHSASPSRAPADTLTPTTWPNCRGIAEGTARTDSDAVNFSVGFLVVIDGDKEDTLERLERFLQENVATAMAGCSSLERRLQETADIVNVMFNVEEDAGQSASCTTQSDDGECVGAEATVNVYHTGGDTSDFGSLLLDSILAQCEEMRILQGIDDVLNPCSTLQVTRNTPEDEDDGPAAVVFTQPRDDDGLDAGGFVGVAIGGLILILLLLLFVRRSRSDERSLKHRHLENIMDDDETYLRDIDGDNSSSPDSVYGNVRQSYVVGDEDSIMSGWTGYTKQETSTTRGRTSLEDSGLSVGYYSGGRDVHKCSSALCEVCEQERQGGLQFVPSGMPGHASMPSDASRTYMEDDTVDL